MALTEKQEYKVEVIPPYSILQVRRADIILKDGVEIARSYHRHVLSPGADVSKEAKVVQEVAGGVWTEECCALYHEEVVQPQIDAAKAEAEARAKEAAERAKAEAEAAAQALKDAANQPSTMPAPEEEVSAGTADVKKKR